MTAMQPALATPEAETARIRDLLLADARHLARVLVVAVPLGVVTTAVVARLAMLLLARTNPSVAGMVSDDGFVIDQFTLSGSLNLALVGAFLGALSGVCWVVLAPLKVGPRWFGTVSIAVGAGVVVASQIVHSDGIDFVFLDEPFLVAVGLFVLIPVGHVLALDLMATRVVERRLLSGSRWTVLGLALSLLMAPLVAVLAVLRTARHAVQGRPAARWLAWPGWPWLARAGLTVLFGLAVASIAGDVAALT